MAHRIVALLGLAMAIFGLSACDVFEAESRIDVDSAAGTQLDESACELIRFDQNSLVHNGEAISDEAFDALIATLAEAPGPRACLNLRPVDETPHGLVVDAYNKARSAGVPVVLSRDEGAQ